MTKIAIDIDNTICNTTEFFGTFALKYDREVLQKNNNINFDKVVPRSDEWTKEELSGFIENIFNKESINIPIKETIIIYANVPHQTGILFTLLSSFDVIFYKVASEVKLR